VVEIKINGKSFMADEGEFLLSVIERADIYVPSLCHHPDLSQLQNIKPVSHVFRSSEKYVNELSEAMSDGYDKKKDRTVVLDNVNKIRNRLELLHKSEKELFGSSCNELKSLNKGIFLIYCRRKMRICANSAKTILISTGFRTTLQ